MKYLVKILYLLTIVFLLISFWIDVPFRIIGFSCLLGASIFSLIMHAKKKARRA